MPRNIERAQRALVVVREELKGGVVGSEVARLIGAQRGMLVV